jgi:Uma2 family endonuclease
LKAICSIDDRSLSFDQGIKLNLYARYGVLEYWVVDVEGKRIITYGEPGTRGYARTLEFAAADIVTPKAFPDLTIAVAEIFV